MTNLKTKKSHFAKSKILLTIICILGLVFSYSCNCRNNSTAPDNGDNGQIDDKGTFKASINMDTLSDTLIVNSKSEVHNNSKLAISFTGKDGTDAVGFEVRITDILDESTDTPLDFSDDKANGYSKYVSYNSDSGALTVTKDGLAKIGALVSDNAPVDRKVKITFDVVADSKLNLINSTNTLINEFHFIKAQKLNETNIEKIYKTMGDISGEDETFPTPNKYNYSASTGTFNIMDKTFTVKNAADASLDAKKSRLKQYAGYYPTLSSEIKKVSDNPKEDGGTGSKYYSLTYDITYADNYECDITPITVRFETTDKSGFLDE